MMKKKLKNHLVAAFFVFLVLASTPLYVHAHRIAISFDSLFLRSWYQKGLEEALCIWNIMNKVYEKGEDLESFDVILGKLVFVQFCVKKMIEEGEVVLEEDKDYLGMVLQRVRVLIDSAGDNDRYKDFVDCADDIVLSIQQVLSFRN